MPRFKKYFTPAEAKRTLPLVRKIVNDIDLFVFDLDGTLTDSARTIHLTVNETFKRMGFHYSISYEELHGRIGAHFQDIFDDLSIVVSDLEFFIDTFKQIYFEFIESTELYPNVVEVLSELKKQKKKITLLTTKGQWQADKIIDLLELRKYFDFIMGRREGHEHKPSPEPLLFICGQLNVKPENTLMIGDTELDIQCGKNAGAKTCAVTYGYRAKNFLISEKPDLLLDDLMELIKLF